MSELTVILGNGTVGHLVTETLVERGDVVRIAQRGRPAELATGVKYIRCDVLE